MRLKDFKFQNFAPIKTKILIVFFALVVGLGWAISSPIGSSPDEDAHIGSIWCANGISEFQCSTSESATISNGYGSIPFRLNICYKFEQSLAANCGDHTGFENVRLNLDNYPVLYYRTMHLFIDPNPVNSIIHMRIFNFLLASLLLYFSISLAPISSQKNLWLVSILGYLPLGIFTVASINPSSWAIAGLPSFTIFALNILTTTNPKFLIKNIFGCFIAAILAIGSRPDSKIYLLMILFLILSYRFVKQEKKRQLLLYLLGVPVAFLLIRNQLINAVDTFPDADRVADFSLFAYNLPRVSELWSGIYGVNWGLGWLDTPIPFGVSGVIFALNAHLFIENLKFATEIAKKIFLFGVAIVFGLILFTLQINNLVVGEQLQPRYFLPFLISLSIIYIYKSEFILGGNVQQSRTYFVGLSFAHSYIYYVNLKRYITGLDNRQLTLDSKIEWWKNADWQLAHFLPPNYVFVLVSIAFSLLIWNLIFQNSLTQNQSAN